MVPLPQEPMNVTDGIDRLSITENRDLQARLAALNSGGVHAAPLSYAQQRLWFLNRLFPGNSVHNESRALRLTFPLDIDALRTGLNEIVQRHEVLRTTFEAVA